MKCRRTFRLPAVFRSNLSGCLSSLGATQVVRVLRDLIFQSTSTRRIFHLNEDVTNKFKSISPPAPSSAFFDVPVLFLRRNCHVRLCRHPFRRRLLYRQVGLRPVGRREPRRRRRLPIGFHHLRRLLPHADHVCRSWSGRGHPRRLRCSQPRYGLVSRRPDARQEVSFKKWHMLSITYPLPRGSFLLREVWNRRKKKQIIDQNTSNACVDCVIIRHKNNLKVHRWLDKAFGGVWSQLPPFLRDSHSAYLSFLIGS